MAKKEKILKILESLDNHSKVLSANELGLEKEGYGEILEIMEYDGLIFGAKVSRGGQGNKVIMTITDNTKITVRGIEYLEQNK